MTSRQRLAYEDYLLSSRWRQVRRQALARAQWRCQNPACPDDAVRWLTQAEIAELAVPYSLEVHHLTYERLGRERPDDLLVLCERCHSVEHGREPVLKGSGLGPRHMSREQLIAAYRLAAKDSNPRAAAAAAARLSMLVVEPPLKQDDYNRAMEEIERHLPGINDDGTYSE